MAIHISRVKQNMGKKNGYFNDYLDAKFATLEANIRKAIGDEISKHVTTCPVVLEWQGDRDHQGSRERIEFLWTHRFSWTRIFKIAGVLGSVAMAVYYVWLIAHGQASIP